MIYHSRDLWHLCIDKDNRNRANGNYLKLILRRIVSELTKKKKNREITYRKFRIQIIPVDQWLSKLSVHQNHLEGLVDV